MQRQRAKWNKRLVGLALVLATCAGAPGARADDAGMADARKQFEAGVNLLDDPEGANYEEAYRAFKKAYALSRDPRVLGNIGYCAFHLERDGEAIDAYTQYLREVPDIDERERAQIRRDLETLASMAARVRIRVKHSATSFVLVDTRTQTRGPAIENSYAIEGREIALRVRPGRHTFKVKTAGAESIPLETTVEPASDVSPEMTFAPPRPEGKPAPPPRSPSLAGPLILATAGVLGIGTGVGAGLLARSRESQIASNCPNDVCPATYDLDGERTRAKTLATVADVSFVAGGVLVGGAALWYLLLPRGASSGAMAASAACSGQGCAFQVKGDF